MTPEAFAYWLQGFVELTKGQPPTKEQWQSIVEHLATVFEKITPEVGGGGGPKGSPNSERSMLSLRELLEKQTEETFADMVRSLFWCVGGTRYC